MNERITCFKRTTDEWYGEFRIHNDGRHEKERYVHVSFMPLNTTPILWRVCVWGNDDLGMEFDTEEYENALEVYTELVLLPVVNKSHCVARNLVYA